MNYIKASLGLLFVVMSFAVFSQSKTGIKDTSAVYDDKMRPGLVVMLETDDFKDFKKYTKKYFKDKLDIKLENNKMKLEAYEIVVSEVSQKELDCIIELRPVSESDVNFLMFMRFGYDFYIDAENYPTEYSAFSSLVRDFARTYLTDYYNEKLSFHGEALDKAKKGKLKLLKENQKLAKKIQKGEKKIMKLQKKNNQNPEKLAENNQKIEEYTALNTQNREQMTKNDAEVAQLQTDITFHSSELSKIQEKINRIP